MGKTPQTVRLDKPISTLKWRLGQCIRFNVRLDPEVKLVFLPEVFVNFLVKRALLLIWIEKGLNLLIGRANFRF